MECQKLLSGKKRKYFKVSAGILSSMLNVKPDEGNAEIILS